MLPRCRRSLTVTAARVLTGEADLGHGWVSIADGRVTGVGAGDPAGEPDVALGSGVLVPGLVDAQVNGAFGVDLVSADTAGWTRVVRGLPHAGVTAFAPTFVTASITDLAEALRRHARVRPVLDAVPGAARTLGVHIEGPFLDPSVRGAHRRDLLAHPSPGAVASLLAAGVGGALLYVTLAPELPGALEAVRRFVAAGVRVAVGHTIATEACVRAAADAGASIVTHLFNGQQPMHHRAPGVVGAALTDERLTCGLVVDGHHVHATAIKVAFACAAGRVMLVSDAVAPYGMPRGRYVLGGEEIRVAADGEPARRADGTMAGGTGRLDDGIARLVATGIPLQVAVEAATRVPADALGRGDLGRITPGARADLVWLDALDGSPPRTRATWVEGRLAYGEVPARPVRPVDPQSPPRRPPATRRDRHP